MTNTPLKFDLLALRLLFAKNEHKLRLACDVLADVARSLHLGDAKALLQLDELHLHVQDVSGHDRLTESAGVDASEEELLLRSRSVAILRLVKQHESADLRHRLHLQHARHDGTLREVSSEELFVHRDVLHSDGVRSPFHFDDFINEEERVPVR